MNKYQKWLAVSIIFLAAAFIMPIYVLSTALSQTLQTAVSTLPDYSTHSQSTTGLDEFVRTQQAAHTQLLILVVAAEILLVACFSVTLWYSIRCRDQCRNFAPVG